MQNNNQNVFWVVDSDSPFTRWARNARIEMFRKLERLVDFETLEQVLDVGVTTERERKETNIFEELYPFKNQVTALSPQDASWLEEDWQGMKYVHGNGCEMPFDDNQFDLVVSFAVIEHVGSQENQKRFLAECFRVAKKYVFIATPNRGYPIEFHTVLPLIHWLPKSIHRKILKHFRRYEFFAEESNLNLLSRNSLAQLCQELTIKTYQIHHIRFFG
ncbi:MAG: class I SAM-dependent methyltransferase [Planctomycetaceae bacterium]|jgi:predicted SAM-dependent methyltransferase|nr:class I SAM-dependent methyltransferase [Planctomycetaceae bacterium]